MADDNDDNRQRGPVMLCATSVLNPGPARVGKIGGNITLPRTVPINAIFAGLGGAFLMLVLALATVGLSLRAVVIGATLGGAAGVMAVTYSPMKGESLFKWLGLELMARRGRVVVDGVTAKAYVGICPAPRVAAGPVLLVRGAVNVPEGSVDERGAFVKDAHVGVLHQLGAREKVKLRAVASVAVELPEPVAPAWARRSRTQPVVESAGPTVVPAAQVPPWESPAGGGLAGRRAGTAPAAREGDGR